MNQASSNIPHDSELDMVDKIFTLLAEERGDILLRNIKTVSEILLNVSLSFSALLGLLAARSALDEYTKRRRAEKTLEELRSKYPPGELGKSFYLLREIGSDHTYICDEGDKIRFWVKNHETMKLLSLRRDMAKEVQKSELEKYEKQPGIDLA